MKFYKCPICGKVIVTNNVNEAICCGKKMEELIPNTVEASIEKHIPVCEIVDNKIKVKVGEVEHPMINEHYIMFIAKVVNDKSEINYLKPNNKPECVFDYEDDSKIYAYCNIHGLWVSNVK